MFEHCWPMVLPGPEDPLEAVVTLLTHHKERSHYVYERHETWYVGMDSFVSLVVNPNGKKLSRYIRNEEEKTVPITQPLPIIAREFISEYSTYGKIFGQVAFNYSAHVYGQPYIPGRWPLLSLMVPCAQVSICRDRITVAGCVEEEARSTYDFLQAYLTHNTTTMIPTGQMAINLEINGDEYKARVSRAVSEIQGGHYAKVVPSRMVHLPYRVNMLATLFQGRRSNTPARTFSFSHMGIQATGFSPELIVSIDDCKVFTEAVAGTQLRGQAGPEGASSALLTDPKEVLEHVSAIRGSVKRLTRVCASDTIAISDFLSIVNRGNVQHLFSHVSGRLSPDKDGWDALPGLAIAVPALPEKCNLEIMEKFEPNPRELYCGAVVMIDPGLAFFEATLALRSVFQDQNRQWLQAGAGITAYSDPDREFTETCEKLASIAPYIVAESTS
ncbi:hypothetical protein BBP40_004931 [Aspergillus hancockii]|nr:hypothetical protein BBP40_004931 [Aspergillus hancockii]